MERIGATASREAIRMPLSQIQAVSRRDHVGSPLAFPWPKIYTNRKPINTAFTVMPAWGTFCSSSCKYSHYIVTVAGTETDPKGGHNAILGDGLQKTRSSRQALEPCPASGKERANHDHPWRRPSQCANDQVPMHALSEPTTHQHYVNIFIEVMINQFAFKHKEWTYLSLRTTPSMQAPNRNTLVMSGRLGIRKIKTYSGSWHVSQTMDIKLT